ncbi:hypothetical protein OPV22_023847 [Ensete ventricosum]|uniref:Uncharacterized protein n=1 Tax=Ensete ventricosum TaxID=4639 RepID=A0AAV8QPH5_ENSVE|nr:hypothetical protein OPV22_023847 [Ensete ventricosum]
MADQQNMTFKAGQGAGQAQVKKDEMMQNCQETKEQAGGLMQQTGDQVKSMAQVATDTVKNAMGMGGNTTTKQ